MENGEHIACMKFMNFKMVRHLNEAGELEGEISLDGMKLYGVSSCEVVLTDLDNPKIKLEMTVNAVTDITTK